MPGQETQFKPGQGGRPKGSKNRRTRVAEAFAQSFLAEEETQRALASVAHNPEHKHWKWTMELLHHYAYGKPVERVETKQDITQHSAVTEVIDFRDVVFPQGEQRNGHQSAV